MNEEVDMDMDNVVQGLEARIWSSGVYSRRVLILSTRTPNRLQEITRRHSLQMFLSKMQRQNNQ